MSSSPGSQKRRNFSRFVRRHFPSASKFRHSCYDNSFGKGHGSNQPNWRQTEPTVEQSRKTDEEKAFVILNDDAHRHHIPGSQLASLEDPLAKKVDSDFHESIEVTSQYFSKDPSRDESLPGFQDSVMSVFCSSSKDRQVDNNEP